MSKGTIIDFFKDYYDIKFKRDALELIFRKFELDAGQSMLIDYKKHINYRKKIIRQAPMHPEALHMLGILCTQTGKLDTAIDLMRKSIKSAPARPDFLFNLGRAYHDREDFDYAITTL